MNHILFEFHRFKEKILGRYCCLSFLKSFFVNIFLLKVHRMRYLCKNISHQSESAAEAVLPLLWLKCRSQSSRANLSMHFIKRYTCTQPKGDEKYKGSEEIRKKKVHQSIILWTCTYFTKHSFKCALRRNLETLTLCTYPPRFFAKKSKKGKANLIFYL